MIDLHVHSTASDGTYTPTQLVEMAKEIGVDVMAITDHDTIDGIDEALEAGKKYGVDVIPGIELKAEYKTELHILGYFIDKDSDAFKRFLENNIIKRKERNIRFVEKFRSLGIDMTYEDIEKIAGGEGSIILKPHFATWLFEHGIIDNVGKAYDEYFNKDMFKDIKSEKPSKREVVRAIVESGGIAVLAHPYLLKQDDDETIRLIKELISYGLSGIEVYHSEHSTENVQKYLKYAKEFNLIVTGGTDFHGEKVKPGLKLGTGIDNKHIINDYSIVCELKDKHNEILNKELNNSPNEPIKTVSSRGIAIFEDKILLMKRKSKRNNGEIYYVVPGGRRENDETLRNNLLREMKEEIDQDVKVKTMFATCENEDSYQHFYEVELSDYEDVHLGVGDGTEFVDKERGEYSLSWIPLKDLKNYTVFPEVIKEKIINKYIEKANVNGYYIINIGREDWR